MTAHLRAGQAQRAAGPAQISPRCGMGCGLSVLRLRGRRAHRRARGEADGGAAVSNPVTKSAREVLAPRRGRYGAAYSLRDGSRAPPSIES